MLADAAAHVEAVEARHHHVEKHEVDAEQLVQPFGAVVRRYHFVAKLFDEYLRNPADARIVVDDQHALAGRGNGRSIDIRRACR